MVEVLVIFGLLGWLFLTFLEWLSTVPVFPAVVTRCGPLPYFKCSGLLAPYPDLEVTRNLFESRSDPAGAILLGCSTNQAATQHRPVHSSLRASLVQCGASPRLVRCQFGIDGRLAEFTRRYTDVEPRR